MERTFSGCGISKDGSEWRVAPKALNKFKTRIRDITRRTRGISLPQLIEKLAPYLMGWRGYFRFCQPRGLSQTRMRGFVEDYAQILCASGKFSLRQWQNGRNCFKELHRHGVPKFNAAIAAGSPTGFLQLSGHPAVQ